MVFYIEIFKWKIFISKCNAHQLSQAYCTVFSIDSTRLLVFIKVNFSSNFMLEAPSNLTFNFKNRGPVSPANLFELEWIPSKLLGAKTGKEKALDTLSASQACCMAARLRGMQTIQVVTAECRDEGEAGREAGCCLSSSSGGNNQHYCSELCESLKHSWWGNAGCYPCYWILAKPHLL